MNPPDPNPRSFEYHAPAWCPRCNATNADAVFTVDEETATWICSAYLADNGVAIDVSGEAMLEMSDAPTNPPTAATVPTSLWQNNLAGFRVERFVNWTATSGSVKYLA